MNTSTSTCEPLYDTAHFGMVLDIIPFTGKLCEVMNQDCKDNFEKRK